LTAHFAVPTAICINKFDINTEMAAEIEKTAYQKGLKVLGKIPYDVAVTKAQILAKSIIEYSSNGLKRQVESLWQSTMDMLNAKEST
jgi:MinD superfamily P-loop ATPase